ncbi:hypothetical protein EfmAA242_16150 [Enterococcus faecium]|nr:hypothetical protein EfmAA242_16150 [Enterococcus faecium]
MGACGRTGRKYCLSYELEQRTVLFSYFDSSGWVPAVALVASIVYLMNWNKERFYLAILTLPAIYFMWKVFNYNYFEPDSVFIEEFLGLVLSLYYNER